MFDRAKDFTIAAVRAAPSTRSRARPGIRRSEVHDAFAQRARPRLLAALVTTFGALALWPAQAPASAATFLGGLHEAVTVGSTKPANEDVNPYGVVTVPRSIGRLKRGDVLVSNFNDAANEQGTGTTLVQIAPQGQQSLFAQIEPQALPGSCPGGVGLTTALDILPNGYVVVGSLPTSNGKAQTAAAGCLIVLDPAGRPVQTISGDPIDGPWDMTEVSFGPLAELFVTNVLNETVPNGESVTRKGTVVRLGVLALDGQAPRVLSEHVIATGFAQRTDPEALVVGPTGLAVGAFGTLYVADTQESRIAAVPDALFRNSALGASAITVARGGLLNGPLGMALAPNGDILTANGGDGNVVETTPWGRQVGAFDTGAGKGGLFGIALAPDLGGLYFVNDAENSLGLIR